MRYRPLINTAHTPRHQLRYSLMVHLKIRRLRIAYSARTKGQINEYFDYSSIVLGQRFVGDRVASRSHQQRRTKNLRSKFG
jgi:hypothetical protein